MAVVKCDHGHSASISTPEFVGQLTLDQKRYARELLEREIKAAEEGPKRVVWLVYDIYCSVAHYPEQEYEKAADHLLQIFKGHFLEEAADLAEHAPDRNLYEFNRSMPRVEAHRVTQHEYETEWFPPKVGGVA